MVYCFIIGFKKHLNNSSVNKFVFLLRIVCSYEIYFLHKFIFLLTFRFFSTKVCDVLVHVLVHSQRQGHSPNLSATPKLQNEQSHTLSEVKL